MDVTLLTTFLAPFLGALLRAGQSALDAAAEHGGAEAADYARGLWQRLRGKVAEHPDAAEAAQKLGDRPGSARRQRALAAQLETLLAGDEDLARDVEALWQQASAAGVIASGDRAVAIGGDVADSVFITGDNVTLEQ